MWSAAGTATERNFDRVGYRGNRHRYGCLIVVVVVVSFLLFLFLCVCFCVCVCVCV